MSGTQSGIQVEPKRKRQKWWLAAAGEGVGPGH